MDLSPGILDMQGENMLFLFFFNLTQPTKPLLRT